MKFLIAGLGNIGPEYADTRHNIGFMVADALAKTGETSFVNLRLAYYTDFSLKGKKIFVIKPTTYMNLSGKAISYWMKELKIPVENVLVVVDELALPFGKLRIKPKGSSAGHNGLKSIEASLGTQEYCRLRFGIGDNFPKGRQTDYVLGPFDEEEQAGLPALIGSAVDMINNFVLEGAELTMTKFNR